MQGKRGVSVFTIDAVIAVTIIAIGIILVFFRLSAYEPVKEPSIEAGQNLVNFLSNTRMEHVSWADPVCGVNEGYTILQQVGEYFSQGTFYSKNCAKRLMSDSIHKAKLGNMGVKVDLVDGETKLNLYTGGTGGEISVLIPFKKIIYGSKGLTDFWSYIIEIQVWQS
ncbi:hypothetical protein KY330_02750 [Candidatus Woesearchaeota archaeon]|nr:hypothetical protein [Candidatus Woesearchaeota archaeon]